MARNKGTFPFAANFEVKAASPLDPRVLVEKKSELISKDTWPLDGDTLYIYEGLLVSVQEERAIYMLVDPDKILETDYSGWERKDGNSSGEVSYEDIYIIEGLTAHDIEIYVGGQLRIDGRNLSEAIDSNKRVYIKYSNSAGAGIIPCSAYREDLYYVSFRLNSFLYGFDIGADSQYIDETSMFYIDIQEKLESGKNIKTVNGESILGEGDIKTSISTILEFTVENVYRAHQGHPDLSNIDTISIVRYIDEKEQIYIHYDGQKMGIIPCGTYRDDEGYYYILFIADNNVFKLHIVDSDTTVYIDSIINLEDIKAEIAVDDQLSEGSTNPVQNKVITEELGKKANTKDIPTKVSELDNNLDFVTSSTLEEGYQPKGNYLTEIPANYITEETLANKNYATKEDLEGIEVDIEVDTELSDTSTNPVQNKAIYEAINLRNAGMVDTDEEPVEEPIDVLSSLYRMGIISQKIEKDDEHNISISNPVWGVIPKQFIDQVKDEYAVNFNEETGYFEYSFVKNLAYDEVMCSVSLCRGLLIGADAEVPITYRINALSWSGKSKLRVLLIPRSYKLGNGISATLPNNWNVILEDGVFEFLEVGLDINPNLFPETHGYGSFIGCKCLKKAGNFNYSDIDDLSENNPFAYCYSLEEVRIKGLGCDFELIECKKLSIESIEFMILNAVDEKELTIRIDQDLHNIVITDPKIVRALRNKTNVSLKHLYS